MHITVTGTLFTEPTAPPTVDISSHIGGTLNVGSETTPVTFQSFVPGASLPPQTPTVTAGVFDSSATGSSNSISAPFSIEQTIDVTLDATGDTLNYSTSTVLRPTAQPVPEPASLALMGFGILGLVGYGWRRRKTAVA